MPNSTRAAAAQKETILLVEDERAVRTLFVRALRGAGYTIHEARNGREAIEIFDRIGDSIDLLITDLRMPLMGGVELANQLRARRPAIKLLCVSGYPGSEVPSLDAEFLAKPFSRDTLLSKIREILDQKQGPPP